MIWIMLHPKAKPDMLGYIPDFLSEDDPRRAADQINANYSHAGGWRPFQGFRMAANGDLIYPRDPPIKALAETMLRQEIIKFYEHSWLLIIQPDGTWEVSRAPNFVPMSSPTPTTMRLASLPISQSVPPATGILPRQWVFRLLRRPAVAMQQGVRRLHHRAGK
jgi:hypothetical protein